VRAFTKTLRSQKARHSNPDHSPERKFATMDIVLEAFDAYLFDTIYAQLFPAAPRPIAYTGNGTSTLSSMREEPTAYYNDYRYQPASQYISFSPSKYAYMSSLPRDNMWRQAMSLFTITWYGQSSTN
jgi:lathosterol oxidase